jgi:hypothetical protein
MYCCEEFLMFSLIFHTIFCIILILKQTEWNTYIRGDYFWSGSVFIKKKVTKLNFLKKKTETEPEPVQTDRFWFLGQKPVQTGLAWFFLVFFCLGSARFGFFGFRLIKLKSNRTGWFFQNFNQFNQFFRLFFFRSSRFNQFFSFFAHP